MLETDKNFMNDMPFPHLFGCRCGDGAEQCAQIGCFFERILGKIDPSILGVEGAQETRDLFLEMPKI